MINSLLIQEASAGASKSASDISYNIGYFLGSNFVWILCILGLVLAFVIFRIIRNGLKTS